MDSNHSDELSLINKYSRKQLSQEDVYIFPVTLCDNEVDRDFERFSKSSLEKLAVLFEGKTGIFDHSMKSSAQNARIFMTWVENDPTRKTSLGESYCALRAKAYMVRTQDNASLIEEIDAGIKKEVSVSCAIGKSTCSVCGADTRHTRCEHIPGKLYSGKQCHRVLEEPSDAYEWSFVAVPAQKDAGVTKSFKGENMETKKAMDIIKSCEGEVTLSSVQCGELCEQIARLEKEAEDGRAYRKSLLSQIERSALLIFPKLSTKSFLSGCREMTVEELSTLSDSLRQQAESKLPLQSQLKSVTTNRPTDNGAFKI